MGRTAVLTLTCLTLFLALFPLTLGKPGLPAGLKADEPAYYLMALSLAKDRDLRAEVRDLDRAFQEFPFRKVDNLILMTDDGWRTVYFGKPYVYSLFAAPFAGAFGANGMVSFNLLLIAAMIWMGALYLARFNDGGLAALFAAGFYLLSNGFAYGFWLHPEVFNMAAVAGCLFFGLHRFGGGEGREGGAWIAALSGALLPLAAYNKPMLAAFGVPLLVGWLLRRDFRRAGAWLAGAVACGLAIVAFAYASTGHPTSYLGVRRQGVTICEPGRMPIGPAETSASPAAGGATRGMSPASPGGDGPSGSTSLPAGSATRAATAPAPAAAPVQGTGGAWTWIFQKPQTSVSELTENLGYFLWGRHTGLFLYAPFALVALLLFVLHRRKGPERWALLAMLGAVALFFLLFIPDNWQGGGGFVGNRYFVNAYPAFLYLVTRLTPRFLTAGGFAAGGLFVGSIVFTPFGAGGPEPTLQSHVRNAPLRYFPLELSLREVPGYDKRTVGAFSFLGRRDAFLPRGDRFFLRGADTVELYVTGEEPLPRALLAVRSLAPDNRVRLEMGGAEVTLDFDSAAAGGETRRVELAPERPYKVRKHFGRTLYVYRLRVSSATGRIVPWTRVPPPSSCRYFPGDEPTLEGFFLGAELTYLGTGASLAAEIYAVRWGAIEVPERVSAGETFELPVRLFNESASPWTADGAARVRLAYHWRSLDGEVLLWDGERTEIELPVPPGGRVAARQKVKAPPVPGRYILELDPVHEQVAWFSERNGGNTWKAEIEVLATEVARP